jgi:hypothetical protein
MAGPNNTLGSPWPPFAIRPWALLFTALWTYAYLIPIIIFTPSLTLRLRFLSGKPWRLPSCGAPKPWGPSSLKGAQNQNVETLEDLMAAREEVACGLDQDKICWAWSSIKRHAQACSEFDGGHFGFALQYLFMMFKTHSFFNFLLIFWF